MEKGPSSSSLQDSVYPTKKDRWLSVILYGTAIFFVYTAVTLPFDPKPIHPYMRIFATLYFAFFAFLIFGIFGSISYILTHDSLIIKCGQFRHLIPLENITAVIPTHNPLSAPALSLDRLHIKFTDSRFGALISPVRKEEFFRDVLLRCPQLTRKDDRLVLRSDTGLIDRDRTLLDYWPWESPRLELTVFLLIFIPALVCFVMFFQIGIKALYILLFALTALLSGPAYKLVGKKVGAILEPARDAGEIAFAALIVSGIVESPGVVILRDDSIIFHPIVGRRLEVRFSDIAKVGEVSYFNGSLLIGKKGFWFTHSGTGRLACAIPKSYAPDFRLRLSATGKL